MNPPTAPELEELRVWNRMFSRKVTEESLAVLKKAQDGLPSASHFHFYLITMVNAMLEKPDGALDALKSAVGDSDPDKLDARAWVVYSDICRQFGFQDTAALVAERARSAKNDNDEAKWELALPPIDK